MSFRKSFSLIASLLLALANLAPSLAGGPKTAKQPGAANQLRPPSQSTLDEALWKKALAIHRRAIVIDTHNDITTAMTNDDYDLGGPPPVP